MHGGGGRHAAKVRGGESARTHGRVGGHGRDARRAPATRGARGGGERAGGTKLFRTQSRVAVCAQPRSASEQKPKPLHTANIDEVETFSSTSRASLSSPSLNR